MFYLTSLSFALVNLKPILPGHVLVSPLRCVPRVSDLTAQETVDLFLTVKRVGRMIERVYGASSLNIAIQDGVDAGQSVPHVHTHIIPRRRKDLDDQGGTDAIYALLDGKEGDLDRIQREGLLASSKVTSDMTTKSMSTSTRTRADGSCNSETESSRRSDFPSVDNETRTPRSEEDMMREAQMLAAEMEEDQAAES